jgi:hypothetical protein
MSESIPKSDQRNAAGKCACPDSNCRLGQIPTKREVLQSSSRAKLIRALTIK